MIKNISKRKVINCSIILLFTSQMFYPITLGMNSNLSSLDITNEGIKTSTIDKQKVAFPNPFNPCFKRGPGTIITDMSIILSASLTICDYDNDNDADIIAGNVNNVYLLKKVDLTYYEPHFIYQLPDNPDGFADDLYRGGLTSADYNNDGKEDFITGGVQGVVRLFINNCTNQSITFDMKEIKDFPQAAWGLTSADFNKDGSMDFAVSWADLNFTNATISIFYNEGNAEFIQDDVFTFSDNYIKGLDSGDYDNDGDIDLLFSHDLIKWHRGIPFNAIGEVSMLFNDGNNNFGNETMVIKRGLGFFFGGNIILNFWLPFRNLIGIDRICQKVTSADYDNDGDIELLVGDNSGKVEFYDNDGTGDFSTRGVIYDFGSFSWGLASADFDGDNHIDFIVAAEDNDGSSHCFLKKNNCSPNFFINSSCEIIGNITTLSASIEPLDYDNDGDFDLIIGILNKMFLLIKNNGVYTSLLIGELPYHNESGEHLEFGGTLTSADYNNDGLIDFISGGNQGAIRLFINNNSGPGS